MRHKHIIPMVSIMEFNYSNSEALCSHLQLVHAHVCVHVRAHVRATTRGKMCAQKKHSSPILDTEWSAGICICRYIDHLYKSRIQIAPSAEVPPPHPRAPGDAGGPSGSQQHLVPLMTCRAAFGETLLERCDQVGPKAPEVLHLIGQLEASDRVKSIATETNTSS